MVVRIPTCSQSFFSVDLIYPVLSVVRRIICLAWHVFVHTDCCCRCCCCCCSVPALLPQQLLLFVMCRMSKIVAGSFNLIPSRVLYFFIQARYILTYPLAVTSHLRPRFAYATSSLVTGMRGAKAGISGVPFFSTAFYCLASCGFTTEYLYYSGRT